jgi:maltose alpha-D-glucosyltransferase/alpha-amylase
LLAESSTGLPSWLEKPPEPLPAFATLIMRGGWKTLWTAQDTKVVETQVLPTFLPKQRWFAGKELRGTTFHLGPWAELPCGKDSYCIMIVQAITSQGESQRYQMPLAVRWGEDQLAPNAPLLPSVLTKVRRVAKIGALFDALAEPNFSLAMAQAMQEDLEIQAGENGHIRFSHEPGFTQDLLEGDLDIRRLGAEQSNSSVILGKQAVLKVYRRLRAGIHPEIEMGRFLTTVADFRNIPALLGEATMTLEEEPYAMAILQRFVENQGDAWQYTIDYLARDLEGLHEEQPLAPETGGTAMAHESYLAQARLLGQRTGEMHRSLLTPTDDQAFKAEPIGADDVAHWSSQIATLAANSLDALGKSTSLTPESQDLAKALLKRRQEALALLHQPLGDMTGAVRCRIHGDYHLGQVLLAQGDFFIVDFEGEPERPLAERRMKFSPLKDVAGMMRSFDYAAAFALRNVADKLAGPMEQHAARLQTWAENAIRGFLDGYHEAITPSEALPNDPQAARNLLRLFIMEKVFYEIGYELANRPAWVEIPLKALLRLLDESRPQEESGTTEPTPRQPEDQ